MASGLTRISCLAGNTALIVAADRPTRAVFARTPVPPRCKAAICSRSSKGYEMCSVPFPAFLEAPLTDQIAGKQRNQLVFCDGNIYLATPTHGDGWFAGARKRARLTDSSIPIGLTPHDLRHTVASLAISAGANVKAVQRMPGHASAARTLDTHADLFDDLDAVAIALHIAKARSDTLP
ncbi:tyrosine-type recombinase/integrase [Cryobacterium sp. Y82]|uniref:tyrosine-type recombinase/integrase n=1 Tax=Cryobacterium sp. Y82 TaxID=2045017 RepID=UPI0011B04638|nr:tyrosine-type recombinase/integrase [Cryobacterium sp. Y82]